MSVYFAVGKATFKVQARDCMPYKEGDFTPECVEDKTGILKVTIILCSWIQPYQWRRKINNHAFFIFYS